MESKIATHEFELAATKPGLGGHDLLRQVNTVRSALEQSVASALESESNEESVAVRVTAERVGTLPIDGVSVIICIVVYATIKIADKALERIGERLGDVIYEFLEESISGARIERQ